MESTLHIETEVKYGKTLIKDMYFTAPYKIMSPFEQGRHIDIVVMSASAGMLSGDSFEGDYLFGRDSDVNYTSQSYEKVFCSVEKATTRKNHIIVEENARVVFLPYPVIPFAGSDYKSQTIIRLSEQSSFAYGDIFTCGRAGMGEVFKMKSYQSRTRIYVGNKLAFADYTKIVPELLDYKAMGMWEKYTHSGLLYLYCGKNDVGQEQECRNRQAECMNGIRKVIEKKDFAAGVTACECGIVVRILAMSGDEIVQFFKKIADDYI